MPPSTYSIVACDLERREWGVAVQSRFLAVGALAPWVQAEVGAVATQAWLNVGWGREGLALLAGGASAEEAVARLTAADEGRAQRQLGVVDARGGSASFTGEGCLAWAGGRTGDGYAVQGNILVSRDTVDAMAAAFEGGSGLPLAERLLRALEAGQAAGGDRRGQQSAALVVAARGAGYGGSDVAVDLRVDDHAAPVAELRRLFGLHALYFGATPEDEWVAVGSELERELRERLARLGYAGGDLAADLEAWAGFVNLEERVRGAARIDPVVLAELRKEDAT
ncbi:MAG TPA: DUF1028 domain-containing protein [Gaiellaceae bacterium]|nr:DUF1028 domain-containing protein [Gaiellaceae bacterium]